MNELRSQGHGPQRHEGQVSRAQHEQRVLLGVDPANRRTGCVRDSSSFKSNAAYAQAEATAYAAAKLQAPVSSRRIRMVVDAIPLKDALGPEYLRHVEGQTARGSPAGTTRDVDFVEGTFTAIYEWDSRSARHSLLTMYPRGR